MAISQRTARTTVLASEYGSGEGEAAAVDAWEAQLALDEGEDLSTQSDQGGNAPKKPVKQQQDDGEPDEDEDWSDEDLEEYPEGDEDEPEEDDPEGDEEDDESDEEDDEGPPEPVDIDPAAKIKVKANGTETEVTFQELKDGYSRTQDYTQKTQALADERKAFEAERQETTQVKQQWVGYLDQMDNAIKAVLGQRTPEEWAKLEQTDRYTYLEERQREQQLKDRLSAVEAEKQRTQQELQQKQQEEFGRVVAAEKEKLLEAIPAWKDNPDTANRDWAKIQNYAKHIGYTDQELKGIVDHRNVRVLLDAARLHSLEAKRAKGAQASDKIRTAPKGRLKAGSPQRGNAKANSQRKSAQRLAKSGSTDAAAAYFETTLD